MLTADPIQDMALADVCECPFRVIRGPRTDSWERPLSPTADITGREREVRFVPEATSGRGRHTAAQRDGKHDQQRAYQRKPE